jgi:predicted DNA-binding antitoxin AbrB/MazE fold protein
VTPSILKNGIILDSMAKHFTAVYEEGVLRPEHPLDLPEGEPLHLIVVTRKTPAPNGKVANALAEIAALPLEGDTGAFSGAEHDSVLYPHS